MQRSDTPVPDRRSTDASINAVVTGATGLLGRRLLQRLGSVSVLTRNPDTTPPLPGHPAVFAWHPDAEPPPVEAFDGAAAVFHLAGAPVAAGRWTPARKQAIHDSRVRGTRHLVDVLRNLNPKPAVFVCASAVGYYGDGGDEPLLETSPPGNTFLSTVCVDWEAEALKATALGIRVVTVRTGIVLASGGGALQQMLPVFRAGLGGSLGAGRQWMPWIHIEDAIGLLVHAATCDQVSGPMNAVSPQPVTNGDFTRQLGQVLRRPTLLRVPRFALTAALGEMSQILTASQRALPGVATDTGYAFRYPCLHDALTACLS